MRKIRAEHGRNDGIYAQMVDEARTPIHIQSNNIILTFVGAHGHQFDQGWDRSGMYRVADGGGLFDVKSLDYARETSCHPVQRAGFYLLQDNILIGYEPDHTGTVRLR